MQARPEQPLEVRLPKSLAAPLWPGGADVAISLTFDVDAEAGLLGISSDFGARLTSLSEVQFGLTRGLPRLLALLEEHQIPATFYVPGYTAEIHGDAIKKIAAAGHEVAHHGYMHIRSDEGDVPTQRNEIDRGLQALTECVGSVPIGYRSPGWELTPTTLSLLAEFGFRYDSSCMGDDRPYLIDTARAPLVELPVHWSLDDVPYFPCYGWARGPLAGTDGLRSAWMAEFDEALHQNVHLTYTMHPHVIGRGYRMAVLAEMISEMRERGRVWFARHADVVELIRASGDDAT